MMHGDDVVLGVLPLSHVYGLNAVLGGVLRHRARLVLVEQFDPQAVLDLIDDEACSVVPVAPPVFAHWLPDDPAGAALVQRWLSYAAGPIASGPAAARLVTVFGAKLDQEAAKRTAAKVLDVIDRELAGKPFAAGAQPTIADIAAYSYIAHAPEGGVSLEPYPHVRAWLARIEALPGFVASQRRHGRDAATRRAAWDQGRGSTVSTRSTWSRNSCM